MPQFLTLQNVLAGLTTTSQVDSVEKFEIVTERSLLPYPLLNPQDSFEVVIHYWGEKTVCQIKITWEDECGKQEHVQALQLI